MYTLTRKLSVVCLTVVLSFLVYGCGGSSKQATITDVSTDMVTASLTPDSGTYTIQPGRIATAGDVTFACPEEGSSCEVTVADDGTVTSTGGMATAMDSDSATRRLAAEQAQADAESDRDAAQQAQQVAEDAAMDAAAAQQVAEDAAMDAAAAQQVAEQDAMDAAAAQQVAEQDAMDAAAAQQVAEQDAMDAAAAQQVAEDAAMDAAAAQQVAEDAAMDAAAAQQVAEDAAMDAAAAQQVAEDAAMDAAAAQQVAEQDSMDAADAQAVAEQDAMDAADAQAVAEQDAMDAADAQAVAEQDAMDAADAQAVAEQDAMDAADAQAVAEQDAMDAADAQAVAEQDAMDAADAQAVAEQDAMDAADAQAVAEQDAMDAADAQAVAEQDAMDAADAQAVAEQDARDAADAQLAAEVVRDRLIKEASDAVIAEEARLTELRVAVNTVDTSMVTTGLTIMPGTYNIPAGGRMNAGDATLTCPAGEVPCAVTVASDGTAMSVGGTAMAMNSAVGYAKLNVVNVVALTVTINDSEVNLLAMGYEIITPGTYTIQPGSNMDVGDANLACPAGGVPCVVTVTVSELAVTTITSLGGAAAVSNSMAVANTREAVALGGYGIIDTNGALSTNSNNAPTIADPMEDMDGGVTRNTDGSVATIALTHDSVGNKYTSEAVGSNYGWSGQTLKRDNRTDAEPMPTTKDEATVYTNIDPATPQLLKYASDDMVPSLSSTVTFVLDAGQDDDSSLTNGSRYG